MRHQIKSWRTGEVLYEGEADSLRDLVATAVKAGKPLRFASLYNANLYNADLSNANLSNADLSNANLSNASLYNANLYNADLYNADLSGQHIFSFAGAGRNRRVTTYWAEANKIWCGCFRGTPKEFIAKVKETHGKNPRHLAEYLAGIAYLRACANSIPKDELKASQARYKEMVRRHIEKAEVTRG